MAAEVKIAVSNQRHRILAVLSGKEKYWCPGNVLYYETFCFVSKQGRGRLLLAAVRLPPSSPELWAAREAHLQLKLLQAPIAGALDVAFEQQ